MTTDRFRLNLFYSGEASRIPYAVFQERTPAADKEKHIHLSLLAMDFPPRTPMKLRKEIEQEWVETLPSLRNLSSLSVRHRVNREFFDSICRIPNLKRLKFISSNVEDISSIAALQKLERLDLCGFSKLTDISPIASLNKIRLLRVENCFAVQNYETIGVMSKLIGLSLAGNVPAPKNLRLNSLVPFESLTNLRHLQFDCVSVIDKSFLSILKMNKLQRLDLSIAMPREIREKIKASLKTLKAGFFVDYDFDSGEFYPGKKW